MAWIVIPIVRYAKVRETIQVRIGDVTGRHAIRDLGSCSIRGVGGVNQRKSNPCDGTQLNGEYIVQETPTIGESGEITTQNAKDVRILRGGNSHVESQHIRLNFSSIILEALNYSRRYAGKQDSNQVCTRFAVAC